MQFGTYPWAAPGAVGPVDPPVPNDANKAMAVCKTLKGKKQLTIRDYGDYVGGTATDTADHLMSDVTWWAQNGFRVEAVLRYRAASGWGGWLDWVRAISKRLAALPNVVAIQVGNEPNNMTPAAGDGSYPNAIQNIAQGVIAARAAVIAVGRSDIRVGFNWAADSCKTTEPMWSQLHQYGGAAFTAAVGFIGIDIYPGTWTAPVSDSPAMADIDAAMCGALAALRTKHMVAAGLGPAVPIVVTESGYPTDSTRSEATQDAVLNQVLKSALAVAGALNVIGLNWFALRDANTNSGQLENGYGLCRDDYSPKPAFSSFRGYVAPRSAPCTDLRPTSP